MYTKTKEEPVSFSFIYVMDSMSFGFVQQRYNIIDTCGLILFYPLCVSPFTISLSAHTIHPNHTYILL